MNGWLWLNGPPVISTVAFWKVSNASENSRLPGAFGSSLEVTVTRLEAGHVGAFVIADCDGTITEWNPAATNLFHWSVDEAVGKNIVMLIPDRLREDHEAAFLRAVSEKRGPKKHMRETYARTREDVEIAVTVLLDSWTTKGKRFYSAEIRRR